jgi:hypothetical protein
VNKLAVLLIGLAALVGYFWLGKSRLEREATAVGILVAAILCEFKPRRGSLDAIVGKYDFERSQSQ